MYNVTFFVGIFELIRRVPISAHYSFSSSTHHSKHANNRRRKRTLQNKCHHKAKQHKRGNQTNDTAESRSQSLPNQHNNRTNGRAQLPTQQIRCMCRSKKRRKKSHRVPKTGGGHYSACHSVSAGPPPNSTHRASTDRVTATCGPSGPDLAS